MHCTLPILSFTLKKISQNQFDGTEYIAHANYVILRILILASIASFIGCKEHHEAVEQQNDEAKAVASIERYVHKLEPLIDPAKLDTLAGKRAATPRLRKACYWLEDGRRKGLEPKDAITQAQALANPQSKARAQAVLDSLVRNRTILERLGCLDEAGMAKLRRGKAPTITRGPYSGERSEERLTLAPVIFGGMVNQAHPGRAMKGWMALAQP